MTDYKFTPIPDKPWEENVADLNRMLEILWNRTSEVEKTVKTSTVKAVESGSSVVITSSGSQSVPSTTVVSGGSEVATGTVEKTSGDESVPLTTVNRDISSSRKDSATTMESFYPVLSRDSDSGGVLVDWSGWSGFGKENIEYYNVYASTEATCSIKNDNLVGSNIKHSKFLAKGLSVDTTYSVRVQCVTKRGAGTATSNATITPSGGAIAVLTSSNPTIAGEIKVVSTITEIDDCDATTNWSVVNNRLTFTSGGTHEAAAGEAIVGETSGATAEVDYVDLNSGSWAAGTAAGYLYIREQSGTFQAENLRVDGNANSATIDGNSSGSHVSLASYDYPCNEGTGSLRIQVDPETVAMVLCTVSAKDLSGYDYLSVSYYDKPVRGLGNIEYRFRFGETEYWTQAESSAWTPVQNTWTIHAWDISEISDASKNGVTQVAFRCRNQGAEIAFTYLDYLIASKNSQVAVYDGGRVSRLYPKVYRSSYVGAVTATQTITFARAGTPSVIRVVNLTDGGSWTWIYGMGDSSILDSSGAVTTDGIKTVAEGSFVAGSDIDATGKYYYYYCLWND